MFTAKPNPAKLQFLFIGFPANAKTAFFYPNRDRLYY